jgi:hypothetical protein
MSTTNNQFVNPEEQDSEAQLQPDREFCSRFVAGNPGGPGNPFARQTAAFKKAIHAATTPDEAKALARKIFEMAMEGNLTAAKLYFSYTAGKPQEAMDPDRVDVHELEVFRDTAPLKAESAQLIDAGLPEPHLHLIRTMRPVMSAFIYKQVANIMDPRKNKAPNERDKREPAKATDRLEEALHPAELDSVIGMPPLPNGSIGKPPLPNGSIGKPPLPNGSIGKPPLPNGSISNGNGKPSPQPIANGQIGLKR